MTFRRLLSLAVLTALPLGAHAQGTATTAQDVDALQKKYQEERAYRGSKDPVRGLAWSRDGRWIASSAGNEIHVWNPEDGKLKTSLKGHEKPVSTVAFAPDGQTLASGSDDFSVRLWNVEQG